MKIFDGKKESERILAKLKQKIQKEKTRPHLAVFLIGDDKPSKLYVELKKKAAKSIGVKFSLHKYKANANQEKIVEHIKNLSKKDSISGIIVQMPLPKKFNTGAIISAIDPKKDVDGFHKENLKMLHDGKTGFISPVLPWVLLYITKKAHRTGFDRTKVGALVNSDIFAETLDNYFFYNNIGLEAVSVRGSDKKAIEEFSKECDILISVLGSKDFITKDMIKDDAILIDAGITKKGKKVIGDFNKKEVQEKARFLTPVPGGVGPMTIAGLLTNVVNQSLKNRK